MMSPELRMLYETLRCSGQEAAAIVRQIHFLFQLTQSSHMTGNDLDRYREHMKLLHGVIKKGRDAHIAIAQIALNGK